MIKIGTIPYIDGQVEASNRAGRSRDVYLVPEAGGWKPRVEGFADGSLPPADPDFGQALRTVRRFIRRNGGSAYRQPATCPRASACAPPWAGPASAA